MQRQEKEVKEQWKETGSVTKSCSKETKEGTKDLLEEQNLSLRRRRSNEQREMRQQM
jgi:hypothetical protein